MSLQTDPDQIVFLSEYQDDFNLLLEMIHQSLGLGILYEKDQVLAMGCAHLLALQRYYVRHLGDNLDLDRTNYLGLIRNEVGFDLPDVNAFNLAELLRESKRYYGHKSTEKLFEFIGDLVGTRVQVHLPSDLIAGFDNGRTRFDGATSSGGMLPWNQSHIGKFRDGLKWANFTYLVDILDAQNIYNFRDMELLLDNIHPAGTQRFLQFEYTWQAQRPSVSAIPVFPMNMDITYFWFNQAAFGRLTFDNGLKFDCRQKFDSGLQWLLSTEELPLLVLEHSYHDISRSQVFSKQIIDPARPWMCFTRNIYNPDGTVTTQYPDTDILLNDNATTNLSLAEYEWSILKTLSYEEILDAAWDLDQANNHQPFFVDIPPVSCIIT